MVLDPLAQGLPCGALIGVIVVATQEEDFQVGCLAETGNLMSSMRYCHSRSITGGFALVSFSGGRDEANAKGFDRSDGTRGGFPVEVLQREFVGDDRLDEGEQSEGIGVFDWSITDECKRSCSPSNSPRWFCSTYR